MRIAFVLTEFPVISEVFVIRQITGLIERGHEVTIFAARPANPARHERIEQFDLLSRTVFRRAAPSAPLQRLFEVGQLVVRERGRDLIAMLRSLNVRRRGQQALNLRLIPFIPGWSSVGRFDVVHAHFGPNGVIAVDLRAVGCFDAPVVTTFHGYDINVLPGSSGAAGYDRMFAEGDAFTFNSNFLANRAGALGCPADRTEVLPMGVDLPVLPQRARSPNDVVMILSVARLSAEKGLTDAIAAVERVVASGVLLRYRIIGGGPLDADLRAQVAAAGLEDIVTLTGPASEAEVRDAYAESDLFLLPSVRGANGSEEAQGLVLQEAQAMGLPVITTDIGGISEGVQDGRSGYVVAVGDVDTLAERLAECVREPALRARLGAHGRELVEQRFDIERLNDRLVELYQEVRGSTR